MKNTVQESNLLAVPLPEKTETYTPVPHRILINEIQDKLAARNMQVINRSYSSNNNGQQMVGRFAIQADDSEMNMMLGFKNSYDKSMTVGLAAGARVIVCSNGMVTGDMVAMKRKHTGAVLEELHDYIIDAVNMLEDNFIELKKDKEIMELTTLNDREQAEILGRLYIEKDIITSTQLNIVKREMEHSENFVGKTAWCLYNNVTESLKTSHVSDMLTDHIGLHKFFKEEVLA
jgi:hypothetical protein